VASWGIDTVGATLRTAASRQGRDQLGGVYALGGFHQLSGLQTDELSGNALLLGRLVWQRRLTDAPVFTRGWFVGGSLEAGNAWADARQLKPSHLRWATSAFVGADTGLGPLYLAVGSALKGRTALYLFIGRP
jgi:NTE family protein